MKLINIGFGNMVSASRLIALVSPESAPIKRMIQEARDRGRLIDATYGRRTRAVIVMDSDHVLQAASPAEARRKDRTWKGKKACSLYCPARPAQAKAQ